MNFLRKAYVPTSNTDRDGCVMGREGGREGGKDGGRKGE